MMDRTSCFLVLEEEEPLSYFSGVPWGQKAEKTSKGCRAEGDAATASHQVSTGLMLPCSVGQYTSLLGQMAIAIGKAEIIALRGAGQGGVPILHVLLCSNKMMMSHCRRLAVPITPLSYTHCEMR